MWAKIKQFVTEGWKAVVALAIPILIGALGSIVDGFGEWLASQPYAWVGVAVGVVEGVAVWLKRNAQPS